MTSTENNGYPIQDAYVPSYSEGRPSPSPFSHPAVPPFAANPSPFPENSCSHAPFTSYPAAGTVPHGVPHFTVVAPRSVFGSIFVNLMTAFGIGCMLFFGGIFCSAVFVAMIVGTEHDSMDKLPEKFVSGNTHGTQKVAIIEIAGLIQLDEYGYIKRQIEQAREDEEVVAVVLRVDSPGGTVSGSDYYLHLLKKLKSERDIPIVVSMGTVAASGGYYVSMAADTIMAERSTITGSIGVVVSLFDMSDLVQKVGVQSTPITSGPFKTMGTFFKPMTPEERVLWESLVNTYFAQFKSVIRDGRPVFAANPAKLDAIATGQVYLAEEAKANGLIDEIGFLDDAIDKAMELTLTANRNNTKVIRYRPKVTFADALLGADVETVSTMIHGKPDTNMVDVAIGKTAEMLSPKMYYLAPRYVPVP